MSIYSDQYMQALVGKTVLGLSVNGDQSLLVFETDQGLVAYETEGDCCSETWFADIIGVKDLIGQRVESAQFVEMAEINDGRTRQKYDQLYGIKLTTIRGVVDILFRNSSNGYYGGDIHAVELVSLPADLRAITADWQA